MNYLAYSDLSVRRGLALLPAALAGSATATLLVWTLNPNITTDALATTVVVPVTIVYLCLRLLGLMVPESQRFIAVGPSTSRRGGAALLTLLIALSTAAVLILSSGAYYALGLRQMGFRALQWSITLAVLSLAFVMFLVITRRWHVSRSTLHGVKLSRLLSELNRAAITKVRSALKLPAVIVVARTPDLPAQVALLRKEGSLSIVTLSQGPSESQ
jgi:hypothetical protein